MKPSQKILTTVSLGIFALLTNIGANAEIYKWTDAKGVTHYTAQKPTQKKIKTEDIEVKIRQAAGKFKAVTKKSSVSTPSYSKEDSRENSSEKSDKKLAGPSASLVAYCKSQRNNLASLRKNFRNTWQDEKGAKKMLNQKERKEKVAMVEKQIATNCVDIK